jgi:hypothetical protein
MKLLPKTVIIPPAYTTDGSNSTSEAMRGKPEKRRMGIKLVA